MPTDLPSLPDVAAACLAVGLLFLARFTLALRRLRRESGIRGGELGDLWAPARRTGAFGPEHEPARQHAVRQLALGFAFLASALVLYGWLVAVSVLWPFLHQGDLVALAVGAWA